MTVTPQEPRTKITLPDEERHRIRWSSTKRGFVAWAEFADHYTRRSRGTVRPLRGKAHVVQGAALQDAIRFQETPYYVGRTRHRAVVRSVVIYEVDALGNVLAVHEV